MIRVRAVVVAVAVALGAAAAPARAAPIAGVMPDIPSRGHPPTAGPRHTRAADVSYDAGPVMHSNRTHVIFWQPSGSGLTFPPGYESLIETFLAQVAADSHAPTNIYGLTGQYRDATGPAAYASTYAGGVIDTHALPAPGCTEPPPPPVGTGPGWAECVSDAQIQSEISAVVAANHLPTGIGDVYFLVTPNGLGSCTGAGPDSCALGGPNGGYCGYHGVTNDSRILYAVIPYNAVDGHCQSGNPRPNASPADPTISTLAHEHSEVVTDPLGDAWFDNQANEIGDLCIQSYGPDLGGSSGSGAYDEVVHGGRYYIQELWSNASGGCAASAPVDQVSFAAPARVQGDRPVALLSRATDPAGAIGAYEWSFGDGRSASRRAVSHVFTSLGTFTVRLRTVDSWGNWGFASRPIHVVLPTPPVTKITSGPTRRSTVNRPRFRFVSTAAIASFQCRVDLGRWLSCRSPFRTARLAPGAHAFSVRARDLFGQVNRNVASERFTTV